MTLLPCYLKHGLLQVQLEPGFMSVWVTLRICLSQNKTEKLLRKSTNHAFSTGTGISYFLVAVTKYLVISSCKVTLAHGVRVQVITVGKDVEGTAVGPWSFLVDYKSETQQEVEVGYKP